MECPKCGLQLLAETIEACGLLCPNKPPKNTSGKVGQLFLIDGEGFAIDNKPFTIDHVSLE